MGPILFQPLRVKLATSSPRGWVSWVPRLPCGEFTRFVVRTPTRTAMNSSPQRGGRRASASQQVSGKIFLPLAAQYPERLCAARTSFACSGSEALRSRPLVPAPIEEWQPARSFDLLWLHRAHCPTSWAPARSRIKTGTRSAILRGCRYPLPTSQTVFGSRRRPVLISRVHARESMKFQHYESRSVQKKNISRCCRVPYNRKACKIRRPKCSRKKSFFRLRIPSGAC